MGKLLKVVGGVFIGLIVLLAVAITLLATVVDPNNFKSQITHVVKQQTGRQLTIQGNIALSYFPWLGVRVHDVSLSNPAGFNRKPFAKAGELDVSLHVLPLLRGKIEIGKIVIDSLSLDLIKKSSGKTNWQDLLKTKKTAASNKAPNKTSQKSKSLPILGLSISNVQISNANLTLNNQQTGQQLKLRNLELKSKDISLDKPFFVRSTFSLLSAKPYLSGQITLNSEVKIPQGNQGFVMHGGVSISKLKVTNVNVNSLTSDFDFP